MGNEDRKALMENVAFMSPDNEKTIEIHQGAGDIGIRVLRVAQWKTKCQSYFNRYYKTSRIIMVPSDGDIIMNTISFLCSESKCQGFVFKNYDIVKHLKFLGYAEVPLRANIGAAPSSQSISYIAYIEQKNTIFICEKVSNGSNICQSLKNIAAMVKYFLTLYNKVIQGSGVTVIGLLIRENEKELVECSFCHFFSPFHKLFESPATFKIWWSCIETYEGWWKLVNSKKQNNLFNILAAEILCFMAMQEKGLPTLTDDKSEQFKQTYFMYTPRQMEVYFSDSKHIVIQGSYGSGKSILGLKKLELIWKGLRPNEQIIYLNFDGKSNLHFLMEKNVKEYLGIPSRKIKRINGIRDMLKSPGRLIYVCHNSSGENLSAILQETVKLNTSTSGMGKTNSHLIIEEYDGETLSHDESGKITKLVKSDALKESNIILLAQPLMKNRSWNIGKSSYNRKTCTFHELENTFKIVKLEEVLRCSKQICGITKCTQNFAQNRDSVFKTKIDKPSFKQRQHHQDNEKHMGPPSLLESKYLEVRTPINENLSNPSNDSNKSDKNPGPGIDLDEAFKRSIPCIKSSGAKSKIISKFGFLCEPRHGVDIEGLKPNLVEFSEDISLTSDIAVIALALVLKNFIGENEATTVLYMAEEQPKILRRSIQLLRRLINETFSYTEDIGVYLQGNKQSKMIFSSKYSSVNGMEFDHVIIVVSLSEYYLKYYLPQTISRCTYDLTFILLPEKELYIRKGYIHKLSNIFSRTKDGKNKDTVANMLEELKRECLVKQVVVGECKACEKSCNSYSILNETYNTDTFVVHSHCDQYKEYLFHLADHTESGEQTLASSFSAQADTQ